MKLWILRPVKDWVPWYDKNFGFIVRAETEYDARNLANRAFSDEGDVWDEPEFTTCTELSTEGDQEIIMTDFRRA